MDPRGLAKRLALVKSAAGRLERSELGDGISDAPRSSEYDLELWGRILSASIQPPPDPAETLALTRDPQDRPWWREVHRDPRQPSRLSRTGN
ncbi:MAG: hypothetical protein K0S35_2329 [Geminicoccaceae bacterium]|nr:hypothetical protein [Geminicoccaceae bacterium]